MKDNVGVINRKAVAQLRSELEEIKSTSTDLINLFNEVKETISNLHIRIDEDMQTVESLNSEAANIEQTEYE